LNGEDINFTFAIVSYIIYYIQNAKIIRERTSKYKRSKKAHSSEARVRRNDRPINKEAAEK
jgi:hypothetical protein